MKKTAHLLRIVKFAALKTLKNNSAVETAYVKSMRRIRIDANAMTGL